mgnify:CR=1 FL=1
MAFEGLSDRLDNAFKKLKSKGSLTESDVRDAMREVRLALLEADVNYKVAKDFTNTVTERAIGAKVTPNCRKACSNCGAKVFGGGVCYEDRSNGSVSGYC